MDGCVLLTSTPSCVVSPRGDPSGCALGIARRGETTHSGVDVNNTHPSMINPLIICFQMPCHIYIRIIFSTLSTLIRHQWLIFPPNEHKYAVHDGIWFICASFVWNIPDWTCKTASFKAQTKPISWLLRPLPLLVALYGNGQPWYL